jgi:hypothetical protein
MPKLKKGSAAAKAFMAKLRAARGKTKVVKAKAKTKKVGAVKKAMPTKKAQYYVIDREAGNVIDIFNTYNTAVKQIMKFEKNDKANKEFVKDFYQIEVRDAETKKVVNGVKKTMPTKKASSIHKDTKSHNVNIKVVSGIDMKKIILEIDALLKYNQELERYISMLKDRVKNERNPLYLQTQKRSDVKTILGYKELIADNKKHITALKKYIK